MLDQLISIGIYFHTTLVKRLAAEAFEGGQISALVLVEPVVGRFAIIFVHMVAAVCFFVKIVAGRVVRSVQRARGHAKRRCWQSLATHVEVLVVVAAIVVELRWNRSERG